MQPIHFLPLYCIFRLNSLTIIIVIIAVHLCNLWPWYYTNNGTSDTVLYVFRSSRWFAPLSELGGTMVYMALSKWMYVWLFHQGPRSGKVGTNYTKRPYVSSWKVWHLNHLPSSTKDSLKLLNYGNGMKLTHSLLVSFTSRSFTQFVWWLAIKLFHPHANLILHIYYILMLDVH